MKFVSFGLLVGICFELASSAAVYSETNENALPVEKKSGTQLSDLCVECKLLILEDLDLFDLTNAASTNDLFHTLAADVFQRTFAKMSIANSDVIDRGLTRPQKTVTIANYDWMLNILKNFGPSIISLKIDYSHLDDQQTQTINRLLNEQCSDSIIELDLENFPGNILNVFDNPFKNVENVSFTSSSLEKSVFTLTELFPKLRRLEISSMEILDASLLTTNFPNLYHFSVAYNLAQIFDENILNDFVLANPQIRSLRVMSTTRKTLKFLSEHLAKLEELELLSTDWADQMGVGDIRFGMVKKLTAKSPSHAPTGLIFDQLEDLQFDALGDVKMNWLEFAVRNSNLHQLNIPVVPVKDWELRVLAENLQHLQIASFVCATDMTIQTINRFMENNVELQILRLEQASHYDYTQNAQNAFQALFGNEWNISHFPAGIIFERKIKEL